MSVKPSTANVMPGLFHLNERVAWIGKWRHGFFSMTAVAALNVGDIVEEGCDVLQTNKVTTYSTHWHTSVMSFWVVGFYLYTLKKK